MRSRWHHRVPGRFDHRLGAPYPAPKRVLLTAPGREARILVIGAGIGGLVAALALMREGFVVEVHEQAGALHEVGAGLSVSRGAQMVLSELGVGDAVLARSSVTREIARLHYDTGGLLGGQFDFSDGSLVGPLDESVPYALHIHRADLHQILLAAINGQRDALRLDHRFVGVSERGSQLVAHFADGSTATGDVVVGADGLRSEVRALMWGAEAPRGTGQVAFRSLVPGETAGRFLRAAGRAAVYYGPGRTFNRYTLRGGSIVNCVAIARTDSWKGEGWTTSATREELLALYEGWHPDVEGLIQHLPEGSLKKWALFDREPLERWGQGMITLLGDAAHPMLPFLGLGAAMSIEDGLVLAKALQTDRGSKGLERYESLRRPRTTGVMLASRREGVLVQGADPSALTLNEAPSYNRRFYDFEWTGPSSGWSTA